MDQLTLLEKAAGDYVAKYGADNALLRINAFEAGAEWQKEHYRHLIELAIRAANVCEDEGAMDTATDIREEIERLQD